MTTVTTATPVISPGSGSLFIVAAPSGAGKSSLVNALLNRAPGIRLSISCTTRAPRPGEQHGREYFFLGESEFVQRQQAGEFLESAQVHGNYYGTSRAMVEEQTRAGQDVLLEIDWQGAQQVRKQFPDAVGIFILPPSVAALEQRLRKRGQDSEEVIAKRVRAAAGEIAHAGDFDYVIINDNFETALSELASIAQSARCRVRQQAARHDRLFADYGIQPDSE
jgi:guanylate kinase